MQSSKKILILGLLVASLMIGIIGLLCKSMPDTGKSCNANTQYIYDKNAKIPILIYHNLMDGYKPKDNLLQINPSEFEEQMKSLQQAGYHTISFEDYYNYSNQGKGLPEKPIIITFDDGYRSNYEYAYPILKKLNMKATIFVVTGRMGAASADGVLYPHFSWRDAMEMEKSGVIDIESHLNLHPDITKVDELNAQYELRISKYLIDTQLNKKTLVIAYPFGQYNSQAQKFAEAAGYKMQAITGEKSYNVKNQNMNALNRLTVRGGTSGSELVNIIEGNLLQY